MVIIVLQNKKAEFNDINITYSLIDSPEEVDLILKSVSSGFQLDLVHVGSINILGTKLC